MLISFCHHKTMCEEEREGLSKERNYRNGNETADLRTQFFQRNPKSKANDMGRMQAGQVKISCQWEKAEIRFELKVAKKNKYVL